MTDFYINIREQRVNGYLHSVTGPAKIWANDLWAWWFNGNRHRYYGPAIFRHKNNRSWWIHGKWIKND